MDASGLREHRPPVEQRRNRRHLSLVVPPSFIDQEEACAFNSDDDNAGTENRHGQQEELHHQNDIPSPASTNCCMYSTPLASLTSLNLEQVPPGQIPYSNNRDGRGTIINPPLPSAISTTAAVSTSSSMTSSATLYQAVMTVALGRPDTETIAASPEVGASSRSTSSCSQATSANQRSSVASTASSAYVTSEGSHNNHCLSDVGATAVKQGSLAGLAAEMAKQDRISEIDEDAIVDEGLPLQEQISGDAAMEQPRLTSSAASISSVITANTDSSSNNTKKSFLSHLLSRSPSQQRPHSRSNRSFSSQNGISNEDLNTASAATSQMPTSTIESSSTASEEYTRTPHAFVTPASPLPYTNLATRSSEGDTTVTDDAPTYMRRSASSLGTTAPTPLDSVFSTASRVYTIDDASHPLARASCPSLTPSTPSSRASRYLSRHLVSPPTASTSPQTRFEHSNEGVRWSPTTTRFFGTGARSSSAPLMSGNPTITSTIDPADPDTSKMTAAPPPLSTFGLALNPLSPQISLGRFGQPLCGAVLDGKYLLIGTSLGLDFLPIQLEGNKSLRGGLFSGLSNSLAGKLGSVIYNDNSPSSTSGGSSSGIGGKLRTDEDLNKKVRKPISLIKKTRFKQLVILAERSNVLLAVAGRNDHVRVYALDSLRCLIDRKMKDIEGSASTNRGLGLSLPSKQATSLAMQKDVKGKGREVQRSSGRESSSTLLPVHNSTIMGRELPPPAYELQHPVTSPTRSQRTIASASSTSNDTVRSRRANDGRNQPSSATSSRFPSSSFIPPPPPSPRESGRTEPVAARNNRRARSRETLRRTSASSGSTHNTSSSGPSARSGSRRGSTATIMPDHVSTGMASRAPMRRRSSVATVVPTSPFSPSFPNVITSSVTRRGSTAQLADMGQVTSEHHSPGILPGSGRTTDTDSSYEWVDTPATHSTPENWADPGYSFPPHPVAPPRSHPAVPPIPEHLAGDAQIVNAHTSLAPRMRMTPRPAQSRPEPSSDEDNLVTKLMNDKDTEGKNMDLANDLVLPEPKDRINARGRQRTQEDKSTRMSFADILREAEADEGFPAVSSKDTAPQPRKTKAPSQQMEARSAVVDSSHADLTSLADFLASVPPPSTSLGDSVPAISSRGTLRNTQIPSSLRTESRRQTSENAAAPSSLDSMAQLSSSTPQRRFEARAAVTSVKDMDQIDVQKDLMQLLSEGPSNSERLNESSQTTRKLSRDHRKSMVSTSSAGPSTPYLSRVNETLANMPLQQASNAGSKRERTVSEAIPHDAVFNASRSSIARPSSANGDRRKRWSLLETLRTTPTPSTSSASSHSQRQQQRDPYLAPSDSLSRARNSLAQAQAMPMTQTSVREGPENETIPPTGGASSNSTILKPRLGQPLDEDGQGFSNITPESDEQTASNTNTADGTTIMFTQRTSYTTERTNARGSSRVGSAASYGEQAGMQSEQVPGNLDYVKLARTKGSRFIRASETSTRTYLAVLCGEQGERIELFTGAKNVSLSLNRTFVLPETPRTIEFQLQGEDLLDLYLIYDSAIFALEPSTVRVREVGIQRNERRQARRERERQLRETGHLENPDTSVPPESAASVATAANNEAAGTQQAERSRHPSEASDGGLGINIEDLQRRPYTSVPGTVVQADSVSVSNRSAGVEDARPADGSSDTDIPYTESTVAAAISAHPVTTAVSSVTSQVSTGPAPAVPTGSAGTTTIAYTTFQQLEYLPRIPPAVLASSFVIPPTYESVLSASPNPASLVNTPSDTNSVERQSLTSDSGHSHTPETPSSTSNPAALSWTPQSAPASTLLSPDGWSSSKAHPPSDTSPLLSPVSLLMNPSAKMTGPPGLFFVSKGVQSTGIVDGDGRSVLRKPISWLPPEGNAPDIPEQFSGLNHFGRLEIILPSPSKGRVCVLAIGPTSVRAIELGHQTYSYSIEVIPFEAAKKQQKSLQTVTAMKAQGREISEDVCFLRDVTYLAKDGQCAYFAERVGSYIGIYSVGAAGHV